MTLQQEKVIQSTWTCDWCDREIINDQETMPPDWIDGHDSDCPGNHYCVYECLSFSRIAWENAFEIGLEAQSTAYEKERLEWVNRPNQVNRGILP